MAGVRSVKPVGSVADVANGNCWSTARAPDTVEIVRFGLAPNCENTCWRKVYGRVVDATSARS